MGLVDAFKTEVADFSREESFIAILVAAMAIDGDISDEEVTSLVGILRNFPMVQRNNSILTDAFNKSCKVIRNSNVDALINKAVSTLSKDHYKTAFLNAIDIVIADGTVDKTEEDFIGKLQEKLGLDDDFVKNGINTVSIKNKVF